jgi:hypothetical protein
MRKYGKCSLFNGYATIKMNEQWTIPHKELLSISFLNTDDSLSPNLKKHLYVDISTLAAKLILQSLFVTEYEKFITQV